MKVFCIALVFLTCAATLPQSNGQSAPKSAAPKAPAASPQPAAPAAPKPAAPKAAVTSPQPAAQAAPKPAAPKAAANAAPAPNAELEKLKAERDKLKSEQAKLQKAEGVVREWFTRWDALDGTPESVARLVDLYEPDALYLTGPADEVIGLSYYQGQDMIGKLADGVGKTQCRQAFYIKQRTALDQMSEDGGAKTVELITSGSGPLNGVTVAVELGASWVDLATKRQFMINGASFFDVQDSGKIRRQRMFYSKGESFVVTGQTGCDR